MNEIVFENRNKAYGAYAIRRSYDDNMLKGLLFTSLLLAFFVVALSLSRSEDVVLPKLDKTNVTPSIPYTYIPIDLTPKVEPKTAKTKTTPPPSNPNKDVAPVISNKKVEEKKDEKKEDVNKDDPNTTGNEANTGQEENTGSTGETGSQTGTGTEESNVPQLVAAFAPEFPGGQEKMIEFLKNNIRYPRKALERITSGTVHLRFVVDEEGEVTNVELMRGIGDGCDEEAMRVVKSMPKWKPGKNKVGKPVKVYFNLPVFFQLE